MQPRLNIALKACRSAAEIINTIYKSKNQDDLRSYDHLDQLLYMHIIESISESYPFDGTDDPAPHAISPGLPAGVFGLFVDPVFFGCQAPNGPGGGFMPLLLSTRIVSSGALTLGSAIA